MSFDLRAQPPVVVMRRRETARRKTRNYDDLSRTNTGGIRKTFNDTKCRANGINFVPISRYFTLR